MLHCCFFHYYFCVSLWQHYFPLHKAVVVNGSRVAGLQRPQCPLLIVFAEKAFSKLVRADHDGTGGRHFDQPGEET